MGLRDAEGADGLTHGEQWCIALAERAASGDVQAFKLIHEILNEREPFNLAEAFGYDAD